MFQDVLDFARKFNLPGVSPGDLLPRDVRRFRVTLMREELREYEEAETAEQELDALVDLTYVVLGTAAAHGFDFSEAWRRVHAANMAKVRAQPDGSDSARGSGHDVVKPPGWKPADLSDLVAD